jgi:hypothetical protein
MTISADFKARFPEFDPDLVDELLPAIEAVYSCYYGGKYEGCDKEVILLLMAHLFVEASTPSTTGAREVAGHTVGNVSETFAGASAGAANNRLWAYFGGTKYGRMYMMLINKNSGAYFV